MKGRAVLTIALALVALSLLAAPSLAQKIETIVVEAPEKSCGETYVVTTELKDGVMFVQAAPPKEGEEVIKKEVRVVTDGKAYAWLGVGIQELDEDMIEAMDLDKDVVGVLINEIYEGSPADEAGLEKGDVVLSFDGEDVSGVKSLVKMVRDTTPGESVELTVLRDGRELTLIATLTEREVEEMVWVSPDMSEISVEILDALDGIQIRIPEIELGMAGLARRGKLGVYVEDLSGGLAEYFEVPDGKGVLVEDIVEDGPADKAGVKAGDVIIRVGDERVVDTASLVKAISMAESGEPTAVGIIRKGREMDLTATIEHPELDSDELRHKLFIMEGAADEHTRQLMLQGLSEEEREALKKELEELREELEELREELKDIKND